MKTLSTTLTALVISTVATYAQATVVLWNFNGNNTIPAIGNGTITTIGGVTNPGYNSGVGSSDPSSPNSGF